MSAPTKEAGRHVEAVLKALEVLDCFLSEERLTIKELMERTRLTRSRVMRLAGTLESRRFLVWDQSRRAYMLGPHAAALGKAFEAHNSLAALARPVLEDLVASVGESATLYVRDGFKRMILARVESPRRVRYSAREGERMDISSGAGGKVLLAFGPEEVRLKILNQGPLPRLTERTITDPGALAEELERVRVEGAAVSLGERDPEVFAVAAPVFDAGGRLVAALGMAGPLNRLDTGRLPELIDQVRKAAGRLSSRLGA